MVIDALMLVGENRFGPSLSVEDALRTADEFDIAAIVAAPARPLDYHLEPANTALAAAAASAPGRLVALGRIDPLNGTAAVAEAERCLGELGCAGLFLHPFEEAYPVTVATDVLEVARQAKAPVVIATGHFALSEPLQVAQLAAAFPDIPLIMTNGGQINISGLSMVDAWNALTRYPNLHVLTNGEYRQDFIERLIRDLGSSRVLYASMAPTFDPRFELRRIRSAALSEAERAAVEHQNAARLFGMATRAG